MKTAKLLIVEADSTSASTLAHYLNRAGYQVFGIAKTGIEAISQVAALRPDLVLIDIVLQGNLDGITVARKIAQYDVPIVYLTNRSDKETLKRARETQPRGYIVKPYNFQDLQATIADVLQEQDKFQSMVAKVRRKAILGTHKLQQTAFKTLNLSSKSDRARQLRREQHLERLPLLSPEDAQIVKALKQEGVYLTSLTELKLPHTKRLIGEMKQLFPHLYTLTGDGGWRQGISRSRKLQYAEIFQWGLGERLLDIVENYIGLPLKFSGVDLRRDVGDETQTGARLWHKDIDDELMVKVIVYLNHVRRANGPYEYIPRSLTAKIVEKLNYTSGFLTDEAIEEIVSPQYWQTCDATAGTIVITDPCNVFHRAKPAKRSRYSITFGYTSVIPKIQFDRLKFSAEEWRQIATQLSSRQLACLQGK